jgi:hypothetical protein
MSAGGLFGTIMNFVVFAGLWTVVGSVFDRIAVIFNSTMRIMPTMQDAANGFALTQMIYGVLPIIVFIALVINYVLVENSNVSGEV